MLKSFYFIIFLHVFLTSFGQKFYLKPLLESKVNFVKKNEVNEIQITQLYKFEEFSILHNEKFMPNSFGLLIGFISRNQSIAIESGFYNTQSESGFRVFYQKNGNSDYMEVKGGVLISTIPLQLEFRPASNFNQKLRKKGYEMVFSCCLSYVLRPSKSVEATSGYFVKNSSNDSMRINEYLINSANSNKIWNNTMFSLGIAFTSFTHKHKAIATIGIKIYFLNYEASSEMAEIFVNQSIPTRYYTKSTGSGFGFSITRNFNFIKLK